MSDVTVENDCFPETATREAWMRWATECRRPGLLLRWLEQTGRLWEYPELAAMVDVPQDPQWHPEGAVHLHVGFVLAAAGEVAEREGLGPEQRAVLMLAALTHDVGKPSTTLQRDRRGELRWTSYGHEGVGVPIAEGLLRRIGIDEALIRQVLPLVERHMAARDFTGNETGARAVRRLARRLAPATLRQLGHLIEADSSGRPPLPQGLPPAAQHLLRLAKRFGVLDTSEPAASEGAASEGASPPSPPLSS